ncbi:molybdopterin cofactor-binding domain-containing protein [uncultured Nostoc sp.]|uniref:molybdopterin cofactor-binding domain-containing protein n=1 Tax=uncultured Nostoc sp. TaxID=340711 RepID=UPI0035C9D535
MDHALRAQYCSLRQWEGDNLTLYETTQGVSATQKGIASVLNIPQENVRVISKYLGGGFGCKALLRSQLVKLNAL